MAGSRPGPNSKNDFITGFAQLGQADWAAQARLIARGHGVSPRCVPSQP